MRSAQEDNARLGEGANNAVHVNPSPYKRNFARSPPGDLECETVPREGARADNTRKALISQREGAQQNHLIAAISDRHVY